MPVGTYTYIWSNGSSSSNQQNLAPGNYIVTVTDEFNCTSMNSFTIDDNTSNPVISQNIIPATCGQNNGSINISISPSGINTFLWTNGNTNEDLINVFAGSYEVTVTDGNGCSAVALFIVPNNNSNFSITSVISDDNSCTNPTGAIDLTITPAGTYSFSWSNGSATEDLSNIASGIYEVTVTDNFNCASSEIFSIESTASFPLLSEILTYSTCGENNGSIDLTVIPSNGNQFIWSTGDTGEDLDNISKGVYSVTVTDINGCSASSAFTIPESKALEVIIDADLSDLNDGVVTCSLQLNVPLSTIDTIVWMPASLFSCNQPVCLEQVFTLIERTEVMVMVIDTNGCMGQASLLLDVGKEFQVYIPNVFTPNGDGPNDMFTIYSNKEVEEVVRLEIFDRWGNLLFINESFPPNEPSYGWDGIFKGQMMNPEVFAYWAVVRYSNGEEHSFKGDVTLVR